MSSARLAGQTLVLNRSWLAIATTPVKNALSLLFTEAARAIEPETYQVHDFESWAALPVEDGEPCITTVKMALRVPEVIVLRDFSGIPRQALPFTRRNLMRRDELRCQYCGKKPGAAELSIDHVLPRSRGGKNSWENCVVACVQCNRRKGSKLLHDAGIRLLRPPRAPQWSPIFDVASTHQREAWRQFVSDKHWRRSG